jgi:2-polyprenyl-3-methyl-5-hydroxy-6-metoxy-1,4-benzoquinol methylase
MLRSLHRRPRGRALAPVVSTLTRGRVPAGTPVAEASPPDPAAEWFEGHFHEAPNFVLEFLESGGLTLADRDVADIGCGDGIIDLALALRGRPRQLVGYDLNLTRADLLLEQARRYAGIESLPANLTFKASEPVRLDAPDAGYDVVITWSAFEHVAEPERLLREMRRILRPTGVLFLQLWPFYHSSKGSHLWDWFPEPFHHLLGDDAEIAAAMRASDRHERDWTEYMLEEYRGLNRITLDDLHGALMAAGFSVRVFEPMTHRTHIPPGLDRYPLSTLGVAGVKLLAAPV